MYVGTAKNGVRDAFSRALPTIAARVSTYFTLLAVVTSSALAANSSVDPAEITKFKDYTHSYFAQKATRAEGEARLMELAKKKPFMPRNVAPELAQLANDLLDAWRPGNCSVPLATDTSGIKIIGESHVDPNSQLERERQLHEAAQGKTFYAHEHINSKDIFRLTNLPTSIPANLSQQFAGMLTAPLFGMEAAKVSAFTTVIIPTKLLNESLTKTPALASRAYSRDAILSLDANKYYASEADGSLITIMSALLSPGQQMSQMVIGEAQKRGLLGNVLPRLLAMRASAQKNDFDHKPKPQQMAITNAVIANFNLGELRDIFTAVTKIYLVVRGTEIFTDLGIPDTMKARALRYLTETTNAGNFADAELLTAYLLRSLGMATNVFALYCGKGQEFQKLIVAQMGEIHARTLQFLYAKNFSIVPVEYNFLATKYQNATEAETLKNLDAFLQEI